MRHRVVGRRLSVTPSHRKAILRNLAQSLIEHGEIKTTLPKAKELVRFIEPIITQAKKGTLHSRLHAAEGQGACPLHRADHHPGQERHAALAASGDLASQ